MKTFPPIVIRAVQVAALVVLLYAGVGGRLGADVAFGWNEALLQISAQMPGSTRSHLEVRACAITHLAIEEAVTQMRAEGTTAEARLVAQRAAGVVAAHDVVAGLIPAARAAIDVLATQHLAAIPDGPAKTRGREAGATAAARLLRQRANDEWAGLAWFSPSFDRSVAQAAAIARGEEPPPSPWLKARVFGMKSLTQFPVTELRTFKPNGEVIVAEWVAQSRLFAGLDSTSALAAYEASGTMSAVAWWNRVARQLCRERELDLTTEARLLATLNVVLADATLAALHWRHTVGNWRSMSRDVWRPLEGRAPLPTDLEARIDHGFYPELVRGETQRALIPPVPNYPSHAATLAGAAQAALKEFFGTDEIRFACPMAPVDQGGETEGAAPPREFASISVAAREAAFVSSLDGVHLREACIAGYSLGSSIGSYVGKRRRNGTR